MDENYAFEVLAHNMAGLSHYFQNRNIFMVHRYTYSGASGGS